MKPADSIYDSMMHNGLYDASRVQSNSYKQMSQDSSATSLNPIDFTDYDDDFGNYYLRKASNHMGNSYGSGSNNNNNNSNNKRLSKRARSDAENSKASKALAWLMSAVPEAVDGADDQSHKRVKRQVNYESSYEKEPPCYGFPLEVNIKSRIKMDQVFPIYGNSQYKKCIKVG